MTNSSTKIPVERTVNLNSLSLYYRDWGGSGKPVILLHGLASNSRIWDLVAPILASNSSVIAIDQRGHGKSDKPRDGYDFNSVTADIAQLIIKLKIDNPVIVGHSWGGSVALNLAVRHPSLVSGLCFIDGGLIEISRVPGNTIELALDRMAPPLWDGITEKRVLQRMKRRDWGTRDSTSLSASLEDIVMANLTVGDDGFVKARLSRENHLEIVRAFWTHKPSDMFPQIQCPVLILPARLGPPNDKRSEFRQQMVSLAQKTIPTNEVIWLENSIHDVPLQRPELVSQLIAERIKHGFFL
ncbi:MAG: hypothetical protein BZY65_00540 [SAR202 cluster bacterium Ae2-Chloro-G2]|nr:MAG: hypothetical protein BZY65_00540 [SAR202 cluster bacterium Ae2-Chloro-G2]